MLTHLCNTLILVDAHVHVHNCFQLSEFLFCAHQNFRRAAVDLAGSQQFTAMLMLTETAQANKFELLKKLADMATNHDAVQEKGWSFYHTAESCSVLAEYEKGCRLIIVAGRQIVTAENLEVLALGTEKQFLDGDHIIDLIESAWTADALAVVPWGFGKWMGRRGSIVAKLLENFSGSEFFLGDNGGRPAFMSSPAQFSEAKLRKIKILPGSDPLPFASECWRPGSFGFAVTGSVGDATPAADLKQILRERADSIEPFGQLERPLRFFRNQLAMQFKKYKN